MINIELRVLQHIASAFPHTEQYTHPVFIANVNNPKSKKTEQVIIKFVSNELIAKEIIAATLGIAIGLPIPSPRLILIPKTMSKQLVEHDLDYRSFVFGSQLSPYPCIRQKINPDNNDSERYLKQLEHWKFISFATIFDELIFNVDRNIGNLLWAGTNRFELIDHELSLSLPKKEAINQENYLFDFAMKGDLTNKYKTLNKFYDFISKNIEDLDTFFSSDTWKYLQADELVHTIKVRLHERNPMLPKILNQKMTQYKNLSNQLEIFA